MPQRLLQAGREKRAELFTSTLLLAELTEILGRRKFNLKISASSMSILGTRTRKHSYRQSRRGLASTCPGLIAQPCGSPKNGGPNDSGLGRESLYKALAPGAKPRFDTVLKVARALGVRLAARPA